LIEQGRLEIFMLKNIQSKFKDAVISGKEEDFLPEIEEGGKIGPKQRLFIYSHAYKARLIETLEEDFSVLHSLVGDDMFNDICLKYIDDFPSRHPSLRYFGQHMPVFLKNSNDFSNLIPAIEMAEYEWTFNDVFDAVDKNAIKFDDVATIAPDAWTTLRFELQPSCHIHNHKWNTAALWSAVTNKEEIVPVPEEFSENIFCLQWKNDLNCFFRTMSNDEAGALMLARDGKAFPDICECLYEFHEDDATMRAAELLKSWVEEGLIVEMDYLKI
jgi:hypothetical protein